MTGYQVTVQHRTDDGMLVSSTVGVDRVPVDIARFADLIELLAARHEAYWGDLVPRDRWVWSAQPGKPRGVTHGWGAA